MTNPYLPEKVKILDVVQETADTFSFTIDKVFNHLPGQFVMAGLLGFGEAPFGICSYSKKFTQLCIRNVGTVTKAITSLKKGDYLFVRGPYGHGFPMLDLKGKDLMIVGGGTGVAPLRGIVQYAQAHRSMFGNVSLYLGFRTVDDLLFKNDLKQWEKQFDFNLTLDNPPKKWKYAKGVVTPLVEKAKINKENTVGITVGPPIMMKFVIQSFKKLGMKDDQIFLSYERFMQCGIGKCGHCRVHDVYVCKHGPVLNYNVAKSLKE